MCSMKPPYMYCEIGWLLLPACTVADRPLADAAAAGSADVTVRARDPFRAVRRETSRSFVIRSLLNKLRQFYRTALYRLAALMVNTMARGRVPGRLGPAFASQK